MLAFLSRRWYYILYPMRAYIIVSGTKNNANAMAAAWVMPVSMDPPLLVVAISPKRYTYGFMRKYKEFTVNVIEYKYYRETYCIGSISGKDYGDKITRCGFTLAGSRRINAPTIREAIGVVECKLEKIYPAGDHDLFLGRVLEAYMRIPIGTPILPGEAKLLLHVGKNMFTSTSEELGKVD